MIHIRAAVVLMALHTVVADAQVPAARPPVPGAPSRAIAFVDVHVVPMDRERVLLNQTVLIENGWITALDAASYVQVPSNAVRIDGRGKYLIPGLGDCHTHLNSSDSTEAERALFLWLANGVTTIRNVDYMPSGDWGMIKIPLSGKQLLDFRARAAAGALWSPRIYTSGPWRTGSLELADIPQQIAAYKAAGYDFIKIHGEKREMLDSVAAAAHRIGIPFMGHVVNRDRLDRALQLGYASIEHLAGYLEVLLHQQIPRKSRGGMDSIFLATLRHHLDLTQIPALAAATRDANVWNCPTQNLAEIVALETTAASLAAWPEIRYVPGWRRAMWEQWAANKRQVPTTGSNVPISVAGGTLDARRQLIKALQDAGAGLLLGTDAPAAYGVPGFSIHRELQALIRSGLTPYQALAAGTQNIATFFGTLDSTGTVASNKRADLVLLNGNPLEDIRNAMRPAGVMIGGRWLTRAEIDRRLATWPAE